MIAVSGVGQFVGECLRTFSFRCARPLEPPHLPPAVDPADDSLSTWIERYLDLAVHEVRSAEVTAKISRRLEQSAPLMTAKPSRHTPGRATVDVARRCLSCRLAGAR